MAWRTKARRTLLLLGLAAAFDFATPAPVLAQPAAPTDASKEVARQRYAAGVKAFDAGQYEDARVAFEEAYQLTRAPGILLNLGMSEVRGSRPVEGGNHLLRFLREYAEATPEEKASATAALEEAKRKAALLSVSVDVAGADVSIDGLAVGTAPLADPIFVEPGARVVGATSAVGSAKVNVEAKRGQTVEAKVRLGSLLGGPGESCRARSDCAQGLKCVDQVCRDDMEGATCAAKADCGGRLVCVDQVCVIPGQPRRKQQKEQRDVDEPAEPAEPDKELEGVRPHIGLMLGGGPTHGANDSGIVFGSLLFALKGGVFIDRAEIGLEFAPASFVTSFDPDVPLVELNAYFGYHIPVAGPVSWPLRAGIGFSHAAPAGGLADDILLEARADLIGISILVDPVLIDLFLPSFRANTDTDGVDAFTYVFGVGAAWLPI
jgi:hypothetical protein